MKALCQAEKGKCMNLKLQTSRNESRLVVTRAGGWMNWGDTGIRYKLLVKNESVLGIQSGRMVTIVVMKVKSLSHVRLFATHAL